MKQERGIPRNLKITVRSSGRDPRDYGTSLTRAVADDNRICAVFGCRLERADIKDGLCMHLITEFIVNHVLLLKKSATSNIFGNNSAINYMDFG